MHRGLLSPHPSPLTAQRPRACLAASALVLLAHPASPASAAPPVAKLKATSTLELHGDDGNQSAAFTYDNASFLVTEPLIIREVIQKHWTVNADGPDPSTLRAVALPWLANGTIGKPRWQLREQADSGGLAHYGDAQFYETCADAIDDTIGVCRLHDLQSGRALVAWSSTDLVPVTDHSGKLTRLLGFVAANGVRDSGGPYTQACKTAGVLRYASPTRLLEEIDLCMDDANGAWAESLDFAAVKSHGGTAKVVAGRVELAESATPHDARQAGWLVRFTHTEDRALEFEIPVHNDGLAIARVKLPPGLHLRRRTASTLQND